MDVQPAPRKVVTTVFLALVMDLLAFTIPLPLFPRLIAWYLHREAHEPQTLLSQLLRLSHSWRASLLSFSSTDSVPAGGAETKWLWSGGREGDTKNWDIVLLGGAMGSLFSLCQCIVSPRLGSLSDRYGRKKVLLATMMGNVLSAIIWLRSTTFSTFLLSRLVGGLSEGNVQLSTAIISDVTTAATRSKSLALIGIAFSICFTFGPSLGAYFASRPLPLASPQGGDAKWNVYATPAALSLVLLVVETAYLIISLPETRGYKKIQNESAAKAIEVSNTKEAIKLRRAKLKMVGWFHCAFLLFFSGAEFTLTFLTYDLFAATNAANGRLLSFIGILAAMLQARHVRPSLARRGELRVACTGLFASFFAFALLATLPIPDIRGSTTAPTIILYTAASALAYTSATVVTGLTAAAATCCDEDVQSGDETLKRGRALGGFRSKGQLGRAVGPLLACSFYWLYGPLACYAVMAFCTGTLALLLQSRLSAESRNKGQKSQ